MTLFQTNFWANIALYKDCEWQFYRICYYINPKGAIKQDSAGKVLMIDTCSTEEHMHTDIQYAYMHTVWVRHIHETKALPNPPALEYSNQTASEEL